ncbi:hypothetical protein KKH23_09240 [Patescibacteria group bacterium]|nr:hypothetical protein [Patescibacteria group bacterium]
MKIENEHYKQIKESVKETLSRHGLTYSGYASEFTDDSPAMWRLYHASNILGKSAVNFTVKTLYVYLNDNHIDTALKQIAKELRKEESEKNVQQQIL